MRLFPTIAGTFCVAVITVGLASACGPDSNPTSPIAGHPRQFTTSAVDLELAGPDSVSHAANGSPVTNAECLDKQVDSNGVGTYTCNLTFADGTHQNVVVSVDANGQLSG